MRRRLGNLAERVKAVRPEETEGLLGIGGVQDLITEIPLAKIEPSPWNARRYFNELRLQELAKSLEKNGLIQPVLVRPVGQHYQLVVGERRYRAAKLARLPTLRAHVRELTEREARHLSLTENLDREDLSAYEEAAGIMDLLVLELSQEEEFQEYQQADESDEAAVTRLLFKLQNDVLAASKSVSMRDKRSNASVNGHMPIKEGVQRPINVEPPFNRLFNVVLNVFGRHAKIGWSTYIRNRLPLLDLPEELRQALDSGLVDQSKAKELARITDPEERRKLLEETTREGLNSEQVRTRVRALLNVAIEESEFSSELRLINRRLRRKNELTDAQRQRVSALLAELRQILNT
jgi:ParB family transcriptional regulator, chromosome partitioning protein